MTAELTVEDTWVEVVSSHGRLFFHPETGVVENVQADVPGAGSVLPSIFCVDVEQLAARMPHYREFDEIDILSIGYWYVTCRGSVRYEPPIPEQESEVPV